MIGDPASRPAIVRALEAGARDGLDLRRYASTSEAAGEPLEVIDLRPLPPTWGLFIAIGDAASGGAVALPLLPAFYRFVGRFLPNGATVETVRNAVYFRHSQKLEPIIVEAAWIVCSLLTVLLAAELRGQTPGGGATR